MLISRTPIPVWPFNPQHLKSYLRKLLSRATPVFTILSIDGPVVPGQPIPVTVEFFCFNPTYDLGSQCRVAIFLDDVKLFQFPDDETGIPYTHIPNSTADIGQRHFTIPAPPADSDIGQTLYTIGDHILRLEVITDGKDSGPFTHSSILSVVPEAVGQWWFRWDVYAFFGVPWKQSYNLSGKCTNYSQYTRMSFSLDLLEKADDGTIKNYGTINQDVDRQQTSPSITFPSITQDWGWLLDGVWAIDGPISRTFTYDARLTIEDAYGNQYAPLDSYTATVVVNVSDEKLAAARFAFDSAASATALGVASGWLPFLAIGAAAATALSIVFGEQALDPPTPNRNFLKEVRQQAFAWPEGLFKNKDLAEFGEFFRLIGEIIGCIRALGEIDSRLMGAKIGRSQQGIDLQMRSQERTLQSMLQVSNDLYEAAERAGDSLGEQLKSRDYVTFLARKRRLNRREMDSIFAKSNISKPMKRLASLIVEEPEIRRHLASPQGLKSLLLNLAMQMVGIVHGIARSHSIQSEVP